MSNFAQIEPHVNSIVADSRSSPCGFRAIDDSRTVFGGYDDAAFATLTLLDSAIFGYESVDSCEAALNSPEVQEVLRIQNKEVLTKAVEELRRRRQTVAAARQKAELEVHRLGAEDEGSGPRQVAERSFEHRLEIEAACQLAEVELCRFEERDTRKRLQEMSSETNLPQQVRIKEAWRLAKIEELRLVEPQVRPNDNTKTPAAVKLEQRLRGEIDVLAAAQNKSIDVARARLRSSSLDAVATAA